VSARFAVAALAALLLAPGGCGGDDSGGGGDTVTQAQSGTTDRTTTTPPSSSSKQGGKKPGDADIPKLEPDTSEPVPKNRTGTPPRYNGEIPIPKEHLKAIERPVYEQSRYLCKRLGVDGMRREYRIESSDAVKVAQGVAANTYQRELRDAVYSGCLAGLRSGG